MYLIIFIFLCLFIYSIILRKFLLKNIKIQRYIKRIDKEIEEIIEIDLINKTTPGLFKIKSEPEINYFIPNNSDFYTGPISLIELLNFI